MGVEAEHMRTASRRGELDALRALVVVGLVFFHAALVFSPDDDYYVKNAQTVGFVTVPAGFGVVWAMMPILFLVVAVRDVCRDGGTVCYTAVERFRFLGVLRHDNLIAVTLVAVPDGLPGSAEISGEVRSPGRVGMRYRFTVERDGAGSVVTDTLRLRAPFGLLRFAAAQAGAVQQTRARVLTARLTRPS